MVQRFSLLAVLLSVALAGTASADLLTPVAVYDYSGHKLTYTPELAIDGLNGSTNMWVAQDDTGTPTMDPPVTGHIVLDMGEAVDINTAMLWARGSTGGPYNPKDVVYYYFEDDNPANIIGLIDDIENDPNIIELWSGTIPEITNGETADIFFSTAFTGRYIGMRIDSGYGVDNFQLTEIRFNAAEGGPALDGDLNGDGMVGSADLDIVRGNWGQSVEVGCLSCGDPSADGIVGSADLDIVRANWGNTAYTAVPEPGMMVLLLCAAVGLLVRRS